MKKVFTIAALVLLSMTAFAQTAFPGFNNKIHTPEAQPFAELSEQVWDLMAAKNADALKDIFHPNAMFVHMGGYWGCEQELQIIGQGFIHYRHAEVYGVDVKQINEDNWAVYSTIKLESVVGGNEVTTPFFVTQTFTKEEGKWRLTAMVFTTRVSGPGIDQPQMNH